MIMINLFRMRPRHFATLIYLSHGLSGLVVVVELLSILVSRNAAERLHHLCHPSLLIETIPLLSVMSKYIHIANA